METKISLTRKIIATVITLVYTVGGLYISSFEKDVPHNDSPLWFIVVCTAPIVWMLILTIGLGGWKKFLYDSNPNNRWRDDPNNKCPGGWSTDPIPPVYQEQDPDGERP